MLDLYRLNAECQERAVSQRLRGSSCPCTVQDLMRRVQTILPAQEA